jgi:hypothetical protein
MHPARAGAGPEGAPNAGWLETQVLALTGLARELDAELRIFHAEIKAARWRVAGRSTRVDA